MQRGLQLLETVQGLELTILHDTCSSLAPYQQLPAGLSVLVEGIMFDAPEAGPDQVMIHFVTNQADDSIDLGLTLSEVIEVTNLGELVKLSDSLATAERSVTLLRPV